MRSHTAGIAIFSIVVLGLGSGARAQGQAAASKEEKTVWYVVRPGDTLRTLTDRYLGSEERWEENWKLNPELENPNRIFPGQAIRLLLPTEVPADGALLRQISNRVEDQPTPLDWTEARKNAILRPRDGIRTYEASSADLVFPDDTSMVVTELSTVFISEGSQTAEQVDRTQIEIVVGQADLESSSTSSDLGQFEIVIGDAKAMPRAGKDSAGKSSGMQTRARRSEGGSAQLMVYSGESSLAAAGAELTVGTGMGSSIPEGKPPTPPKKLLPAPEGKIPAAAAQLATPSPAFRWNPVLGARRYTLEVCSDERCGVLVERVQGLADPAWQATKLPVEKLYWRVTAVSASGLDGYPSTSQPFEILSAVADTEAPDVKIDFTGPQRVGPRFGLNDSWIVGPGGEIEITVVDGGSGVGSQIVKIDGETVDASGLRAPWAEGERMLAVVATDRAGNTKEVELPFVFDSTPPVFSWGAEGGPAVASSSGDTSQEGEVSPSRRGRREVKVGKLFWELDSDLAQIRLRPQTRKPIKLEGFGSVGPERGLWVLADDAGCSYLTDLTYELVAGADRSEVVLRYEATDCVGNASRGRLPLRRSSRK